MVKIVNIENLGGRNMTENKNKGEKVKLWTRQHKNILNDLEENGVYRVKKEYILNKMDTISNYYLSLYDWYGRNAEKLVVRPEGASYPIWLSVSEDMMLQPTEDTVILEIEIDKDKVVYTDVDKWGYVVNYFYLPIDKEDEEDHDEELKKFGVHDDCSLIMGDKGNFYPLLKNKVMKSWERLFEPSTDENALLQATVWEIKKEWIVNILK